jgi:hypothetical protein
MVISGAEQIQASGIPVLLWKIVADILTDQGHHDRTVISISSRPLRPARRLGVLLHEELPFK